MARARSIRSLASAREVRSQRGAAARIASSAPAAPAAMRSAFESSIPIAHAVSQMRMATPAMTVLIRLPPGSGAAPHQ